MILKFAIALVALGGAVSTAPSGREFLINNLVVPFAGLTGWVSNVETRPDIYRDYYLTACAVVTPKNVQPKELKLLNGDPAFQGQPRYLITAVEETGLNRPLKQRQFILNHDQIQQIGLENTAVSQSEGVILNKKLTLTTFGQYLKPFASIFLRVQKIESKNADNETIQRVNHTLLRDGTSTNLDLHYQNPTHRSAAP